MTDAVNIHKVALDSISAHVAILDATGLIIETNRAWREFAQANGIRADPSCVGTNYLETCAQASREPNDEPAVIAAGIRRVIEGTIEEFFVNYPCHAPDEERWFSLRVVRFREAHANKVVMSHEDITPLMKIQRELVKRERDVRAHAEKLSEQNIALKVLLDHRQKDRLQLEENMVANIRTLVLPYVQELLEKPLRGRERTIVSIIEERLTDIAAPFLNRLSSIQVQLTPQEIKVATMVREGRSSAEIADVLQVTTAAVDFHRKQIRKKLGMTGTGRNLRSYLLSLKANDTEA